MSNDTDLPNELVINGVKYARLDGPALAAAFCEMEDYEQAAFFDEVMELARLWPNSRSFQWSFIDGKISGAGRQLICEWYEYLSGVDQ